MHAVPGLACPGCRGDLRADGEASLICEGCAAVDPIRDGIRSFIPTPAISRARGSDTPDLTVVIPASNRASHLDQLLAALRRELRLLEISHEILVIDSGAYGAALRSGFQQALGECILTLDADGSHDPSFLGAIWAARHDVGVVIASRYIAGGGAEMPAARKALSRTLSFVLRRGLSLPYSDLSSGYRLYRREALEARALPAAGVFILREGPCPVGAPGDEKPREAPPFPALGPSPARRARPSLPHP